MKYLLLLSTLFLAACAGTAPQNNNSRAQFLQQVWVAPELRGRAATEVFDSVYIAPVHVSRLESQSWWQAQNERVRTGQLRSDAAYLARYFRSEVAGQIGSFSGNRLRVVSTPGPRTLVVELAITELVPSKATWNMASTAAGFVVPGAGLLSAAGSGSISMEGRLVNAGTNEVVAVFADRRTDLVSPVNLRSFQWYAGAQKNIDLWARCAAEVLNAPAGKVVNRPSRFTLSVW